MKTPKIEIGLRLGVGRGSIHIIGQVNSDTWKAEIKAHKDSSNFVEVNLPVGLIEELQKVEDLERKTESLRKGKDYFERERNDVMKRLTLATQQNDSLAQDIKILREIKTEQDIKIGRIRTEALDKENQMTDRIDYLNEQIGKLKGANSALKTGLLLACGLLFLAGVFLIHYGVI